VAALRQRTRHGDFRRFSFLPCFDRADMLHQVMTHAHAVGRVATARPPVVDDDAFQLPPTLRGPRGRGTNTREADTFHGCSV
jgi:hypothetical protein